MGDYGKRKCKQCLTEMIKKSPLDMFCSVSCTIDYKNKKSIGKTPAKRIKPISDKRKKQNQAYLLARKVFLMEDKNKYCPVMEKVFGRSILTTEIHHTNGRENDRLNDRNYWLAVSSEGHKFIHANPTIAYQEGWMISSYNQTDKE